MSKELNIAIKAAKEAGILIMKNFGKVDAKSKKGLEIVTEVDKKSEKIIVNIIRKNFPDHCILSEEIGLLGKKSDYCWVIDPLDGTTNYAVGFPYFAVSIALAYKEEPVVGVIYDPYNNDIFTAEKGRGAFMNNRRIKMRKESKLNCAIFGSDLGYKKRKEMIPYIRKMVSVRYIRIIGSAAKGLVDVASNRTQAYIHNYIKPWDMAAGCLLIREAGGLVTAIDGSGWSLFGKTILASNPDLHRKLLKVLK